MLTNIVTSKHTVFQFFQVQFLLFMELWKQQKRLISTKVYYKSGQNYITTWRIFYDQLGHVLLQIGAASFYYKLGQVLLQIGEAFFITNWGKCYYKLGQLNYYKSGQVLLHIRGASTNQGNCYYKFGQLLQIGTIITNWGITTDPKLENMNGRQTETFQSNLQILLIPRHVLYLH